MLETIAYITPEVYVYQIPPLKSINGHRATEWDTDNSLWKGRLKVVEIEGGNNSLQCEVRLEDSTNGELFAAAPYSLDGKGVEPVTDSSRYFAIRVVDGSRQATLGLGFPDRSMAFEFNIALQDYKKHAKPLVAKPIKDYSLKPGQSIHVNVEETTEQPQFQIPNLLPPPPSSKSSKKKDHHQRTDPFDDDFGDFV
jgi:hypothetical protein